VALGAADKLHCYAATLYIFDHFVANELVLGVSLAAGNLFGWGFGVTAGLCGIFQALRADDDLLAKRWHAHAGGIVPGYACAFSTLKRFLEYGFMLTENALFLLFLFGMTSSFPSAQPVSPSSDVLSSIDVAVVAIVTVAMTVLEVRRAGQSKKSSSSGASPDLREASAVFTKRPATSPRRARSPGRNLQLAKLASSPGCRLPAGRLQEPRKSGGTPRMQTARKSTGAARTEKRKPSPKARA